RMTLLLLTCDLFLVDWVNLAWDTEFTERKPLNDVLEKELDGSEDDAFRTLYHCFLSLYKCSCSVMDSE
uniref:Uncharacterized protein n=1 Tax=Oryzias sinensis TaxID=183150 RepID=A0A8C7WYV9_9TELE